MTWMLRFARRLAIAALTLTAWAFAPVAGAWGDSTPPVPAPLPYFAGIGASPLGNTIRFYGDNVYDAQFGQDVATLPSDGWPSSINNPQAMAMAPDGTLWVAAFDSASHATLFDLDFSSGTTSATMTIRHQWQIPYTPRVNSITVGPNGKIFGCTPTPGGDVDQTDPSTGVTSSSAYLSAATLGGTCRPGALLFAPDGYLYVGDYNTTTGADEVKRFDITGPTPVLDSTFHASDPSLKGVSGIAQGPDGDIYVSGATSNNVIRFDGTTGADKGVVIDASTSIFGSYLGSPGALAFGADGELYVDSGGATTGSLPAGVFAGIVEVDPSSGAASASVFSTEHVVSMIFQDHPPAYSVPQTGPGGTRLCPSPDMSVAAGISPSGTGAYGQTLAEVNPFDPIHQTTPCDPGGVTSSSGGTTNLSWTGHTPALAPWVPTRKPWQQYNLYSGISAAQSDYTPYNGRWVTLYTQIPANYSVPANNPNGPWWYLRYQTDTAGSFTDRTTIELQVLDSPPRLIN